ncbi:hypothetical protein SEA_KAUALA_8 [Microbacterium phage Kauala]|nr:hypothetical protein SEA_KAUALA_8 [Microbacterium phage Kauala]
MPTRTSVTGVITDSGAVIKYGTYRWHYGGIVNPRFKIKDRWHSYGWADKKFYVALRNEAGVRIVDTLTFNAGEDYTEKTFRPIGGGLLPTQRVALNVQSESYGPARGTVTWTGELYLG